MFPGSLRPFKINLAAVALVPFAFDFILSDTAGDVAIQTVDRRTVVIGLIPGTPVCISGAGVFPTGVNGTTVVNTADLVVY